LWEVSGMLRRTLTRGCEADTFCGFEAPRFTLSSSYFLSLNPISSLSNLFVIGLVFAVSEEFLQGRVVH
jgi:hypothetical protein